MNRRWCRLCFSVRRVCALLPHVSDDQVGWRDEEVVDSLESCADGMMYFADTGLRNYLCTMKKKHTVHTLYTCTRDKFAQFMACKRHVSSVSATKPQSVLLAGFYPRHLLSAVPRKSFQHLGVNLLPPPKSFYRCNIKRHNLCC